MTEKKINLISYLRLLGCLFQNRNVVQSLLQRWQRKHANSGAPTSDFLLNIQSRYCSLQIEALHFSYLLWHKMIQVRQTCWIRTNITLFRWFTQGEKAIQHCFTLFYKSVEQISGKEWFLQNLLNEWQPNQSSCSLVILLKYFHYSCRQKIVVIINHW